MIKFITIKQTGATPQISAREQGRITKEVLARTAAHHHRFMEKHFTIAGAREYGYKPRKGEGLSGKEFWKSYTGKKKKQKGHQRPLTWSGASETLAKIRDVQSSRDRARLVQHARALNFQNPNSDIDMRDEITAISESEAREDIQFANQLMQEQYRDISATITVKV